MSQDTQQALPPRTLNVSVCSETCIVPNSAANALPIRPATTIDVITGLNSLEKARANTPPTDLFKPNLVNSLTNWMVKAIPTKAEVKTQTETDFGPTPCSFWRVFLQWIFPLRVLIINCPARVRIDNPLHRYEGGDHLLSKVPATVLGSLSVFISSLT